MHSCDVCNRAYSTKGALTRHLSNHSQQLTVACPICEVSFRRKDLMLRHARIHDSTASPRSRRRCHTACESCRSRRSRCDGQLPCDSCVRNSVACDYSRIASRLSTRLVRSAMDENCRSLPGLSVGDRTVTGGSGPRQDASGVVEPEMAMTSDDEPFAFDNGEPDDAFASWSFDGLWSASTAWQSAHEDIYLQDPIDFDDSALSLTLLSGERESFHQDDATSGNTMVATVPATTLPGASLPQTTGVLQCNTNVGGQAIVVPSEGRRNLDALISNLVSVAASGPEHASTYNVEWQVLDAQVSQLIASGDRQSREYSSDLCLDYLAKEYFINFHPLWPLILDVSADPKTLHPLLYLTLASIGALYHRARIAAHFGSLLHAQIRDTLLHTPVGHKQTAAEALDLGRAMLLIQVAALYFEQDKAYSAAQQLGAKLNTHAHRMRLFNLPSKELLGETGMFRDNDTNFAESRQMLSYGILRAETFMSIFFNRKPLLSYEEVNLPLPLAGFSDNVDSQLPARRTINQSTAPACGGMLFSDLVRVALDEDEILPAMRPTELELLLFGLQHDVWRFCHDPGIFRRLIQRSRPGSNDRMDSADSRTGGFDLLNQSGRKMRKLVDNYNSTVAALARWKKALALSQLTNPADQDRSAFLSGLILYELSLLRLLAPIGSILQIVYRSDDNTVCKTTMFEVVEWTKSAQASESITHAQTIGRLLHAETGRFSTTQARYNILTLIAIHHAAAVVWAIIGDGGHRDTHFSITEPLESDGFTGMKLEHSNNFVILSQFADLYPGVTSSWGMQSSFHKIVSELARRSFPLQTILGGVDGQHDNE